MSAPVLSRSTANGRTYVHPLTGETVPSVTTCISSINKPALPRWAAKVAAEYAASHWDALAALEEVERVTLIKGAPWVSSGKAADLGTAVHDAVDAWCTDRPMPSWEPGVEEFMAQFVDFLEKREPVFVHNEATVWNRTEGYAGTLDWFATIGGRLTLGDTKTGKAVYPEVGLQLAALAHAEFILTPDGEELPIPTPEVLGVLHLRPRSWSLVPVDAEGCWEAFLAAKSLHHWTSAIAPTVLGPKVKGAPASESAA